MHELYPSKKALDDAIVGMVDLAVARLALHQAEENPGDQIQPIPAAVR